MGEASLKKEFENWREFHTGEFIHIRKRTVLESIVWLFVFIGIYVYDVYVMRNPNIVFSVGVLMASQLMAILLIILGYSLNSYGSDGNYRG